MEKGLRTVSVIAAGIFAFIMLIVMYNFYFIKVMKHNYNKNIVIAKGDRVDTILDKIGTTNKFGVKIYLKISNTWNKLKPGSYYINGEYTLAQVFNEIKNGKNAGIKIVIPEGYTAKMVIEELINKGLTDEKKINLAIKNYADFYYPHPKGNYEGYFYPATYEFYKGMPEDDMLKAMFGKFLAEFPPEKYPDKDKFYEKLIMASIVEKEAYHKEEKPIIASVFYNRLNMGKRLESCATVEYLYDYSKEKLYYKNLKIDSPYNTYTNKGLPPAPISNPSKDSVYSAFYPEKTDYLFFVAKEDRHHIFSKDYGAHLKVQQKKK